MAKNKKNVGNIFPQKTLFLKKNSKDPNNPKDIGELSFRIFIFFWYFLVESACSLLETSFVEKNATNFFFENMSQDMAEKLLVSKGTVGSFLVRSVPDDDFFYFLSVRMTSTKNYHFPITVFHSNEENDEIFFSIVDQIFNSLTSLVCHFKENPIFPKFKLGSPLLKENLETREKSS